MLPLLHQDEIHLDASLGINSANNRSSFETEGGASSISGIFA
jgi:hypothetical protein